MTTVATDLAAFLLARIDEDEEAANAEPTYGGWTEEHVAWVLAECEAKRRIIEKAREKSYVADTMPGPTRYVTDRGLPWLLALLALPYAGHPDYREEWRP